MFLKSLILRGFKTFADLTELEFPQDARITAIVGPNGCGKSNVMDATRWVLGEDNPRNLRVAQLSNIIFAGTSARKPLSMAEISLVFDNSAGRLPIPFSEVVIKRRTFREGESEFFINKNQCRLKDIKDLLLDTGLGEGTYSIITQGQVDAILSRKGEERRAVFEEAAGISKYKFRKAAAEKKLIAAEQNILRISDLKIEVAENVITLEEQANKAGEYLTLQARVKELDIGLNKALLAKLFERKEELAASLAQVKTATQTKKELEEKDYLSLKTLKEEHRAIELEIDSLLIQLDRAKDLLRDLELDRRFAEGELKREELTLVQLKDKQTSLQQKIEMLQSALEQETQGLNLVGLPLNQLFTTIVEQTTALVNQLSQLIAGFGRDNNLSLYWDRSVEKEETYRLKIEMLTEEAEKIIPELEQIAFGRQAHLSQLTSLKEKIAAAQSQQISLESLNQKKQQRDTLAGQINILEDKIRNEDLMEKKNLTEEASLEVALARLDGELAALSEKLAIEYNLTLEEVAASNIEIANIGKVKREVEEGKARLRALEPVNLLAIEEFAKGKERLAFIEAQLADLGSARENLGSLITELDQKAEQTFLSTMEQLSTVFSETFSRLFVGGEAKISLAAGAPPLEAEVEISVRPSGRKWLPLPLLSGGERSLSAIAILFSLLKIRPSPFCFLDEVDAALDDANIGRFTQMLIDFSDNTQIIVITHNKRTMNAADNIYGVTMEEPGVSKVLSMKLAEVVR
ncbi:MAG: AAA family ATPase [bacterium]